jgi:hypothetical protein
MMPDVIFFENALVLLKESTEIRIIVVIGPCLLDLFGVNVPENPNFAEKVGYRVSGVPRVQGPDHHGHGVRIHIAP